MYDICTLHVYYRVYWQFTGNPLHIPLRHLRKRKSWTIIYLFYLPLEFQSKMKTWIYQHSTWLLNYTSVLSNTTILLDLPNVQEKPLSKLLTCILSAIKTGLQSYCDTSYSRDGMNQMWILKNSKYMLEYIQLRCLSSCNIITIFDSCNSIWLVYPLHNYSSLYKLREMIQLCFMKKNDQRRCTYLVRGRDISYFVNNHSDSTKKFFETDIINISSFFIDNIFVFFGGRVFQ